MILVHGFRGSGPVLARYMGSLDAHALHGRNQIYFPPLCDSGLLDIRCDSDDYEVLIGSNATDISKQFAKMWGIKLITYPAFFKSRCLTA